MSVPNGRRAPKKLSAETKWEVFLQITAGEISQADAARKWGVDVSTIIGIRRTVKDAAIAALPVPLLGRTARAPLQPDSPPCAGSEPTRCGAEHRRRHWAGRHPTTPR